MDYIDVITVKRYDEVTGALMFMYVKTISIHFVMY